MLDVTSKSGARMFVFESNAEATAYVDPKDYQGREDSGWVGKDLKSWEDARAAACGLWDEGVEVLLDFVRRLSDIPEVELKDRRRRTRFDEDDGDEFDVDRNRSGQAPWRRSVREETHGASEVTVVMDMTASWRHASKDLLWRGAAAIALTQILEARGYRVELWVSMGNKVSMGKGIVFDQKPVVYAVGLKRTSDPLDLTTLVNVVSGWYYRTIDFSLWETLARRTGHKTIPGYPLYQPTPSDLDELSRDPNRIYSSGVFSFDGAEAMIRAEVKKITANNPVATKETE